LNKAFYTSPNFYYSANCNVNFDNYETNLKNRLKLKEGSYSGGPITSIMFRYPEGITGDVDGDNVYVTTASPGTYKIKAEIKCRDCSEKIYADIPVKVVKKYPKASLLKNTITIGSGFSSETFILVSLISKESGGAAAIKSVEVMEPEHQHSICYRKRK